MVDASMDASKWRWQVAYRIRGEIYWWDYPDDVNDNLEQAYELAKHGGEGRIRWEYKWGPRWPRLPPGSVTVERGADGKLVRVGAGDGDAAKRRQIVSIYFFDTKNKVQLNGNSRQEREMRRILVD